MLWIRKLHYRVHKSPCLVPFPSRRNRVTPSHFLWSITMLSSHLFLAISSGPFLHFSAPNPCIYFFSPPCMLHTPSTSYVFHLITIRGQPHANVDLLLFNVRLHESQRPLKQRPQLSKRDRQAQQRGIIAPYTHAVAYRGGGWGVQPPPPKFRRSSKIVPNSTRFVKTVKIAEFRTPTPQNVRKKRQ